MTTALPSAWWFGGNVAYNDPGVFDFDNTGAGSPFPDLKANYDQYDEIYIEVGPRYFPVSGPPYTNWFLEYHYLWRENGRVSTLTALAEQFIALHELGKAGKITLSVGGIHYSGTTNQAYWTDLQNRGRRTLLLDTGGGGIKARIQEMFEPFIYNGSPLCKLSLDGAGVTSSSHVEMIEAVRAMEGMGFTIVTEAYTGPGSVFEGYPSVTLSATAIANAATFDLLPSQHGVLVSGAGYEGSMATWRAANRKIYGSWLNTAQSPPWAGFGTYGG